MGLEKLYSLSLHFIFLLNGMESVNSFKTEDRSGFTSFLSPFFSKNTYLFFPFFSIFISSMVACILFKKPFKAFVDSPFSNATCSGGPYIFSSFTVVNGERSEKTVILFGVQHISRFSQFILCSSKMVVIIFFPSFSNFIISKAGNSSVNISYNNSIIYPQHTILHIPEPALLPCL